MDINKRHLFSRIATITAGAALIPVVQVTGASEIDQSSNQKNSGKRYGMVIDLRRCVGCQACTVACTIENQSPLGQFRTTVNQYEVSEVDGLNSPAAYFMLPKLCNHCEKPACIPVCPTGATYQQDDGIVVVDNKRCVGCGYCVQACPYEARFINKETNTADKCTFCTHRLEAGLLPACVETCVGEARVIGDLNDPNSQISQLIQENKNDIKVLRPESNTSPQVFYIGMNETFEQEINGEPAVKTLMLDTGEESNHDH